MKQSMVVVCIRLGIPVRLFKDGMTRAFQGILQVARSSIVRNVADEIEAVILTQALKQETSLLVSSRIIKDANIAVDLVRSE